MFKKKTTNCKHSTVLRISETRIFSYLLNVGNIGDITTIEEGNKKFKGFCLFCGTERKLTSEQIKKLEEYEVDTA